MSSVRAALDYFEGWFEGGWLAAGGEPSIPTWRSDRRMTPLPPGNWRSSRRGVVERTAEGIGKTRDLPDRRLELEIDHVHREIANVTVRSNVYVEYLHLVRMPEGWKIVNALWQRP